jgi:micrococcal nuclease
MVGSQKEKVRYLGVDTPEPGEPCGLDATDYNVGLVGGHTVCLESEGGDRDVYERLLRWVWLDDGRLVEAELVRAGLAEIEWQYPQKRYHSLLQQAQAVATPHACALSTCRIKGNISASGERIYHLPGCPHYENTYIDVSAGERWFCTEQEAVAAGWRKCRSP